MHRIKPLDFQITKTDGTILPELIGGDLGDVLALIAEDDGDGFG